MLLNYLKIEYRLLKRNKGFLFINVTGLAIGIACCILICLWVLNEVSVNSFHENFDSIHLIRTWQEYGADKREGSGTPPALGPVLQSDYPEVLYAGRLCNGQGDCLLASGDTKFIEEVQIADPEIFKIFTFPFIRGNIDNLFGDPHIVVLSETIADKFFSGENPVGRKLTLDNQLEFTIAAVMADIPRNSTISFDVWVPMELSRELFGEDYIDTWYNLAFRTYVLLEQGADPPEFSEKITSLVKDRWSSSNVEPFLYPLRDVYLKLYRAEESVKLFSMVAALILVIASINFINLTTARSAKRAREVGLRKAAGASRPELMRQFFCESVILTMIALALAILIVEISLPAFNHLIDEELDFALLQNPKLMAGVIGITLVTGLLSGIYPALVLSSFIPVNVLKGTFIGSGGSSIFRKALVVFQFSISVILLISTSVIFIQTKYMKDKDLGFDKNQLLYISVEGDLKNNYTAMKNELLQNPEISSISLTSHSPTGVYWNAHNWNWPGKNPEVNPLVTNFYADHDFLRTFDIKLSGGEFFRPETQGGSGEVIVNQSFAALMEGIEPVGSAIYRGNEYYREDYNIIGVVKNFHFKPVQRKIEPLVIYPHSDANTVKYMFFRAGTGNIEKTLAEIENSSKKFNPDYPFSCHFLDEDYERMLEGNRQLNGLINVFAALAMFISCLGLFGLASFMAQKRSKEIGIRKVLGASVMNVVRILSFEFLIFVAIANLIAWPAAWYFMNQWLQNFAYRIVFSEWLLIFPLSAAAALLIAIATVSFQAIRAANANPVNSIRYE